MLKKIILHETLLNLASFRFILVVGLFVLMFFGGLAVSIANYKAALAEYNEVAAVTDPYTMAVPPNPLSAFAKGTDQHSSVSVVTDDRMTNFTVKTLGESNVSSRLSMFETLDFNFVVKVLLSLGAMLVTFASVSGERFSGTLKLASASGASKKYLILSKLLASFICLVLPLIVCTIIACVALAINGMLPSGTDILRVGLFALFASIYILFFVLVGLIISISTNRPQESLVAGVLCWLALVFVMPAIVPQISKLFVKMPSARAMGEARNQRLVMAQWGAANTEGPQPTWPEKYKLIQVGHDAEWESYRNQFANYAAINRWLALISPSDIFNNASMEIVGNGIHNAIHSKKAILQHKDNLLKDPKNSSFVFKRLGLAPDLTATLVSIFVLCLEIVVLLLVAYKKFMSLDLREG
jgi:ABC-type transport system involved in multi-copper enzyme maturation permease subunit